MKTSAMKFLSAAFLLLAAAGYAQADATRAAIEKANSEFSAAAAKGDGAAIAALYTADGQVLPAGSEPIRGGAALQKFWQGALSSGVVGVSLQTLEVFNGASSATEVGHYELRDKAGKTLDQGKYIVIWEKVGAQWKLARDMFSTNMAPAAK
jgi:ketosteroid isomerase-like protein